MVTVYGNLVDSIKKQSPDVVFHGCNCYCIMGAGIALTLATEWPAILDADKQTRCGSSSKLGTYSKANISSDSNYFTVYNLYTQNNYGGGNRQYFNYNAFNSALVAMNKDLGEKRHHIMFGAIGSGYGGGDWKTILPIILRVLSKHQLTFVSLA